MCKHSAPSSEITDFRPWLAYQAEHLEEIDRLLDQWTAKKAEKIGAGKAALVETTEISGLEQSANRIEGDIRLGALLEALADGFPTGEVRLGQLRFKWASPKPPS